MNDDGELTDMTVGAFLVEKMRNMHTWLSTADIKLPAFQANEVACVIVANMLLEHKASIEARNFPGLVSMTENAPIHAELITNAVVGVHQRPDLHDKFWRYLDLFCSSVQ